MKKLLVSRSAVLLAAAVLGCESGRDVHGYGRYLRVEDGGRVTSDPINFNEDFISADVLTGEGDFEGYRGQGYGDAFVIPRVPDGEYYLRDQAATDFTLFIVTDSSDMDLSEARFGRRPSRSPVAGTQLDLFVSNLEVWQAADALELVSTNLGLVLHPLETYAKTGTPAVGQDRVTGLRLDFAERGVQPIDATAGDRAILIQLATREESGVRYAAAARRYETGELTMADGTTTTSSGAFTDVPDSASLAVEWKATRFEAERAKVNPSARTEQATFSIHALPAAASSDGNAGFGDYARAHNHGGLGAPSSAPLLLVQTSTKPVDVAFTARYGNPFEGADEFVFVDYAFSVEYLADGATTPAVLLGGISADATIAQITENGTLEPRVGPVSSPRVNDLDALQPQSGVGVTPTISWEAPAIGAPNAYGVALYRVRADGGATKLDPISLILTQGTEVVVPVGILTGDEAYAVRISAYDEPTRDMDRAPFRYGLGSGTADVLSAIFKP